MLRQPPSPADWVLAKRNPLLDSRVDEIVPMLAGWG
jgi:hypothetical protein